MVAVGKSSVRPWEHVSASQVEMYLRCPRKWFNRYVLGWPMPQTGAQKEGEECHAAFETYMKTVIVPAGHWAPHIENAKQFLPTPGPDLLVEFEIRLSTPYVPWIGYVDLAESRADRVLIVDYKTTKDFRWCKTPDELRHNVQLLAYAYWAFITHPGLQLVELMHLYIKKTKKGEVQPVRATVERPYVLEWWHGKALSTLADMNRLFFSARDSDNLKSDDVTPNPEACGDFGGCAYRPQCGLDEVSGGMTMAQSKSAVERLKALVAKQKEATPELKKAFENHTPKKKKRAEGIIPPDAPSRETPLEEVMEGPVETKTKNVKQAAATVKPPTVANVKPVLYVDCIPVKGAEAPPVLLEDWIRPAQEAVAQAAGVTDYRLVKYEAKPLLAAAIRERIDTVPSVLVISSANSAAEVALDVLIPYALKVTRGLKG